jgi:ATP-binding cassette subfamily B protein
MLLALVATAVMGLLPVVQLGVFAAALNGVAAGASGHGLGIQVATLVGSFLLQQVLAPWMPWLEGQLQVRLSYILQRRYFVRYGTVAYETLLRPEWAAEAERARQALPVGHRPFVLAVSVLQSLITLAGYVVLLWRTASLAALVVVATVVLIAARQVVTGRRQSDLDSTLASARVQESYLRQVLTSTDLAAERFLFGYQPYVLRLWKAVVNSIYDTRTAFTEKMQRGLLLWQWGQLVLVAAVYVTVVILASHNIGGVVVGFQVVDQVLGRSNALMLEMRMLSDDAYRYGRYRWFVAKPDGTPTPPPSAFRPEAVDRVTVDGVTYTYPESDHPAIEDLSLTFPAGAVTGLVGPNGAGKSTLCAVLAGLLTPQNGSVGIDGKRLEPHDLQGLAAVVYAPVARFPVGLYENVGMGKPLGPEADHLLRAIGAVPEAAVLGPDYRESVDLSGGQWQVVAIARAANTGRPILILDEPTAALDPETEGRVLDELFGITARLRLVTLLVSHRVSTVMRCDDVVVMDGGHVVQRGRPADLLGTAGLFRDLYAQQVRLISRAAGLAPD